MCMRRTDARWPTLTVVMPLVSHSLYSSASASSVGGAAGGPAAAEMWEVCNRPCIGRTEVQLAQLALDGAALLCAVEGRLAKGETLLQVRLIEIGREWPRVAEIG